MSLTMQKALLIQMTSKLNKTEKYKRQVDLKEYYAKLELLEEASLSEADRFYLKNFGIYNLF